MLQSKWERIYKNEYVNTTKREEQRSLEKEKTSKMQKIRDETFVTI